MIIKGAAHRAAPLIGRAVSSLHFSRIYDYWPREQGPPGIVPLQYSAPDPELSGAA
jgi:hypothetical protein